MQSPDEFQSLGKEGPAAWNPVITGDGDSTISSFVADERSQRGESWKNVEYRRSEIDSAFEFFLLLLGNVKRERNGSSQAHPRLLSPRFSKVQTPDVIVDPLIGVCQPMKWR